MRAVQITEFGGPDVLKVRDVQMSKPEDHQVLIRIEMAGVNFIDIYQRRGTYPVKLPYVPGLEGSGIVEAVGSEIKNVKPGDRVAYLHSPGAYAEFAIVNEKYIIPLPDNISFEQGAAFPLQGMTAHYLLHEFRKIKAGETVLIHAAAGGMGLLLVQWAKHLGAKVYGTTSSEEKARKAKDAGADEVILYSKQDFVQEIKCLTNDKGVDLIIDGVGKTTFSKNLHAAAKRGNIVIFGAASGPADPIVPNSLMEHSLTISGGSLFNYLLTKEEFEMRSQAVIEGIQKGWLKLHIDHVFPLEKTAEAHEKLEGRQTTGKILLSTKK
jgi:NADPH2:quinone reductase